MNQDEKLLAGVQHFLKKEVALRDSQAAVAARSEEFHAAEKDLARLIRSCGRELLFGNQRFYAKSDGALDGPELVVDTYDAIVLKGP